MLRDGEATLLWTIYHPSEIPMVTKIILAWMAIRPGRHDYGVTRE
jgi:hypothetical protein